MHKTACVKLQKISQTLSILCDCCDHPAAWRDLSNHVLSDSCLSPESHRFTVVFNYSLRPLRVALCSGRNFYVFRQHLAMIWKHLGKPFGVGHVICYLWASVTGKVKVTLRGVEPKIIISSLYVIIRTQTTFKWYMVQLLMMMMMATVVATDCDNQVNEVCELLQ